MAYVFSFLPSCPEKGALLGKLGRKRRYIFTFFWRRKSKERESRKQERSDRKSTKKEGEEHRMNEKKADWGTRKSVKGVEYFEGFNRAIRASFGTEKSFVFL
jgi:hypothetical protein